MDTIVLKEDSVVLIDQTLLPERLEYVVCRDVESLAEAIVSLRVRGAPALGVAGAFGLALAAMNSKGAVRREVLSDLEAAYTRLKSTRPTAVNLFTCMKVVMDVARVSDDPRSAAVDAAKRVFEEDVSMNKRLEQVGAELFFDGDVVLTHCNAGSLATSGYGTALGVIKEAARQGKDVSVFAGETRPLLQGARLTSFEMVDAKIPVTVITDGMAGFAMKKRGVSKVIVGADRIALNGDTANKIGTYGLAILAKAHEIPFYVAAPTSTIDPDTPSGDDINIEFRSRGEIEFFNGRRIVPRGAEVLNPAFDVTPAEFITGIITERGVFYPPFDFGL
ncbi:methylthioribose-1-phosphate isomerase [archaeon BMS3Abin16]|nr:methylthioribose-1-phosphate isomerase [archaeon BMS3Abin16]HDY74824.1 S-methyl-5-thioribose-1-phosphate isomerase [Euryarchaeota archaeon]